MSKVSEYIEKCKMSDKENKLYEERRREMEASRLRFSVKRNQQKGGYGGIQCHGGNYETEIADRIVADINHNGTMTILCSIETLTEKESLQFASWIVDVFKE